MLTFLQTSGLICFGGKAMLIFYSSVADVKTRAGVAIFTNWIHFFSQRPQRKLIMQATDYSKFSMCRQREKPPVLLIFTTWFLGNANFKYLINPECLNSGYFNVWFFKCAIPGRFFIYFNPFQAIYTFAY